VVVTDANASALDTAARAFAALSKLPRSGLSGLALERPTSSPSGALCASGGRQRLCASFASLLSALRAVHVSPAQMRLDSTLDMVLEVFVNSIATERRSRARFLRVPSSADSSKMAGLTFIAGPEPGLCRLRESGLVRTAFAPAFLSGR